MSGEILIPHMVKTESDAEFKARVRRQQNHKSEYWQTSIFNMGGTNYVVGAEAQSRGRPTRITGPDKLKKGYLDVLAVAALTKLLPDGHDNVIIGCAHTTNSIAYIDDMSNALGGVHEVKRADGTMVRYKVRAMVPWDEPAGGLLRFMTRPYAAYNAESIDPGHRILVVDIGGKVSSMYPAIVLPGHKVQVLWNDGTAFNVGIQDVLTTLDSEMRDLYPDAFKVRSIPDTIKHEALRRGGVTTVRNQDVDVTQSVLNATGIILDEIERVYVNEMDKALDINHIVCTGGGSGLLFRLLNDIFENPDNTYLADEERTINFANLRGGEYALTVWATENYETLRKYKTTPAMVVLDPGNSDIKGKLVGDGNGAA